MRAATVVIAVLVVAGAPSHGQSPSPEEPAAESTANFSEEVEQETSASAGRSTEMSMEEDPDAIRRSVRQQEEVISETAQEDKDGTGPVSPPDDTATTEGPVGQAPPSARLQKKFQFEWYASARVHASNTYDVVTGDRESNLSDGNSRIGARVQWDPVESWSLFSRLEMGFDSVGLFSGKANTDGFGSLTARLFNVGVESDKLLLSYGQSWSTYYKIAGLTDKFSVYGGNASGVYNAGTVGDKTGLGRAEEVIQARVYVDAFQGIFDLKPFNLNLQYQRPTSIPFTESDKYEYGYGVSAWLETENEIGIGLAYNRSAVPKEIIAGLNPAGLSGDAEAFAMGFRAFGDKWYASLTYSDLKNVEVTDLGQYVDSQGVELYAQRQVSDRWWIIGGGNYLRPYDDEPNAGEFEIRYAVIGARYTFGSFERMVYTEFKHNQSRTVSGASGKDELSLGVRWDF